MRASIIISIWLLVVATAAGSSLGVSERSGIDAAPGLKYPDFYQLVVQYPLSVCERDGCGERANLPTMFSIHGLWDEMNDGKKRAPITSTEKFDVNKLKMVKERLEEYWFDALRFDEPAEYPKFWKHEWDDHGTRSGLHLRDYFVTTVDVLHKTFREEFDALVRKNNKYLPGREFKLNEFVNSFATTRLAVPWPRCYPLKNRTLLVTELLFRIDPNSGGFMSQAKADGSGNNCFKLTDPNNPDPLGLLPSTAPIT